MEYTVPKRVFINDSVIDRMEIYFSNGDYFTIRKNEICKVSVTFYDKLVVYGRTYCPVAQGGFIKLRIQGGKAKNEGRQLYNPKEYIKNRKSYIEDRTTTDCFIHHIKLFNVLNWNDIILGDIYATLEGEYLYIRFKENPRYGSYESENHSIILTPPKLDDIFKIRLYFENCEFFDVYKYEILSMNLNFDPKLEWDSSGGYGRYIKNGYIHIELDKSNDRCFNIFCDAKKPTIKHLKKRIYGKGIRETDICDVCIEYYMSYPLYQESLRIESLNSKEHCQQDTCNDYDSFDSFYFYEDDDENDDLCETYESGFAEKLDDGSILITFGRRK